MKEDLIAKVEIPEGVQVSYENYTFKVQGSNATLERTLFIPVISVSVSGNEVTFSAKKATQREKRLMNTLRAHLRNMFRGCMEDHVYKVKVCSGHFPMNVSINNGQLVVKNFLGEAVPRVLKLKEGAKVDLKDGVITVTSPYIEIAGQQAADIEQLTRITNRDRRIFQDGLYIIEKDGTPI